MLLHCGKIVDLFVLAESLAELLILAPAPLHLHRDVPVLPLEELRAHGELVLLVALRLPRPLRRQVVLHATLPVLVVLSLRWDWVPRLPARGSGGGCSGGDDGARVLLLHLGLHHRSLVIR